MMDPTKFSTKPLSQISGGSFFILNRSGKPPELAFMADTLGPGFRRAFIVVVRGGAPVRPEWVGASVDAHTAIDLGKSVAFAITPMCSSVTISETQSLAGAGIVCWGGKSGLMAADPRSPDSYGSIVSMEDGKPLFVGDVGLALFEQWDLVTADDERRVLSSYRPGA